MIPGIYQLIQKDSGMRYYNWGHEDGRMASGLWMDVNECRRLGPTWDRGSMREDLELSYSGTFELFEAQTYKPGIYRCKHSRQSHDCYVVTKDGVTHSGWNSTADLVERDYHANPDMCGSFRFAQDNFQGPYTFIRALAPKVEVAPDPTVEGIYKVRIERPTLSGDWYCTWRNGEWYGGWRDAASARSNQHSKLGYKPNSWTFCEYLPHPKEEKKVDRTPAKPLPTLRGVYEVMAAREEKAHFAYWHGDGWGPYTNTKERAFESRGMTSIPPRYNPPQFFNSWRSCGWEEPLGEKGPVKQIYKVGVYKSGAAKYFWSHGDGKCSGWNGDPMSFKEKVHRDSGPYTMGTRTFTDPKWIDPQPFQLDEAPWPKGPAKPGVYHVQSPDNKYGYEDIHAYWDGAEWHTPYTGYEPAAQYSKAGGISTWKITDWQEPNLPVATSKVPKAVMAKAPSPKARAAPSHPVTDRRRKLLL